MSATEATGGDVGTGRDTPGASSAALNRTLLVVIIGSVMSVLDMTIVNVALRSLSGTFGAPLETIQWTVTAYTLALAAAVPTAPWMMARVGAKRAYLTALTLFSLGSLLAHYRGRRVSRKPSESDRFGLGRWLQSPGAD